MQVVAGFILVKSTQILFALVRRKDFEAFSFDTRAMRCKSVISEC